MKGVTVTPALQICLKGRSALLCSVSNLGLEDEEGTQVPQLSESFLPDDLTTSQSALEQVTQARTQLLFWSCASVSQETRPGSSNNHTVLSYAHDTPCKLTELRIPDLKERNQGMLTRKFTSQLLSVAGTFSQFQKPGYPQHSCHKHRVP